MQTASAWRQLTAPLPGGALHPERHAADEQVRSAQAHPHSTWFFMCGPIAANVFLLGAAFNLHLFKRHHVAIEKVFDMRRDEVPTARGVAGFAGLLFMLQMTIFGAAAYRRGSAFGEDEVRMELLLVLYCVLASLLLFCPFNILHRPCRYFLLRKLSRCFWPFQYAFSLQLPPSATPFVEVYLADGLTSLSKFIQDAVVAFMLLALSFTQELEQLRHSYVTKMKQSPLPYFAASVPYIIRATQCLISFKRTTNANDRFLHLLNTLKYCSSLLVISVGAYPQVIGGGTWQGHTKDQSTLFLFCAVFNSLYSFMWDVIMDWGLGQPGLPRRRRCLRHQLLYRPAVIYYVVIVLDFGLRVLWVTKWWDWRQYGVDFKMVSQVAEVIRRCMWNCVRVEWQCIKLDLAGHKKDLDDSLEGLALLSGDEEDEEVEEGAESDLALAREAEPVVGNLQEPDARDEASSGIKDEVIAAASITVATFPQASPVTMVKDSSSVSRHLRRHHNGDGKSGSFAEKTKDRSLSVSGSGATADTVSSASVASNSSTSSHEHV